ncbi:MAG: class I SAM-dependent methyltransferase [Gammaproteobacteria bacterium]|nr:class I SAM-dependent methyltransferase [Gammaproteobacteria bacterium]
MKPRVVVETGVLYGASSAHILDALDRNGEGTLYSIDLECDPYEPPHDFFVPSRLQERWRLILGDSRRRLPVLLRQLGTIDHFHHDSLHTAEHMHWEFETAFAHLPIGGVLTSDDVLVSHSLREIGRPNAFAEFCRSKPVRWATFGNVGIAVKLDL